MTTPDFEGLILDRLFDVNQNEINGIKRAFRLPPVSKAGISKIPYAYCLPTRITPVRTGGGLQRFDFTVLLRICGHTTDTSKDETNDSGVKSIADLIPFINLYRDYFFSHQGLETTANPDALQYLVNFTFGVDNVVSHGVDAGNLDRYLIDLGLVFTFQWMC